MKHNTQISLFLLISSIIFSGITSNPIGVILSIALSWVYIQNVKVDFQVSKLRNDDIEELKTLIGKVDSSIRNEIQDRVVGLQNGIDSRIKEINTKVGEVRLAASTAKVKETGIKNKYRF